MDNYKLVKGLLSEDVTSIRRLSDGASIPIVADNKDYREYLAWIAEGNEPEPADA